MENRLLLTGLHTIADIHCVACDANLGWIYVCFFFFFFLVSSHGSFYSYRTLSLKSFQEEAFEEDQKYKIGKVILEKATICRVRA